MQLRLDTTPATSEPLVHTGSAERNGEVSPKGRWLAYQANDDSGSFEIFVKPFPDVNSGRFKVSTGGGVRPLWARDGRELFYLTPGGALMRVGVEPGPTWSATAPTKLLDGRYFAPGGNPGRTYDVSKDGQRFLMIKQGGASDAGATPTSIVVVQNWIEELKRLVPTK